MSFTIRSERVKHPWWVRIAVLNNEPWTLFDRGTWERLSENEFWKIFELLEFYEGENPPTRTNREWAEKFQLEYGAEWPDPGGDE